MGIFKFLGEKKALKEALRESLSEQTRQREALEESLSEQTRQRVLDGDMKRDLAMLAAEKEKETERAEAEAERLGELSTKDELTEVFNRRGFMEEVQRIISAIRPESAGEFRREGFHHMTLVIIDIDYFKKFNDRLGHVAGDDVLKKVARHLMSKVRLRTSDIVGRYGGEEFIIALPGASEKEVLDKLSALRADIGEKGKTGIKFTEFVDGMQLVINMSCGIASFIPGEDVDKTIKRADKALYAAKNAGRDTALIYDPKTMENLDPRGKNHTTEE